MSRHLDEHLDLCAGYALDSLDAADRARLLEHLSEGCEVCEAALRDFGAATVLLASSAPPARPSPALRARVLAAAESTAVGEGAVREGEAREGGARVIKLEPRRAPRWTGLAWAAAAAFAAVAGFLGWETARLGQQVRESHDRLARLEQQVAEERRWADVLSAPEARIALIAPTAAGAPELRGRATYDPATRRAVLVFEHVQAQAGHDYELWAIRGAAPRALGLIRPDASGRAVLRLDDAGDPATLNAFAVSLEPEGGAPTPDAPTGPVVMLGKLGG